MPFTDRETGNAYRRSYRHTHPERAKAWTDKYRQTAKYKARKAEWARRHKEENPDRYRDKSYRLKYGITLADYDRMFEKQGGRCAICLEPCRGSRERPHLRLHVDHCHETGKVRGLLCRRCNVAIGYLEHVDRGRMEASWAYLKGAT